MDTELKVNVILEAYLFADVLDCINNNTVLLQCLWVENLKVLNKKKGLEYSSKSHGSGPGKHLMKSPVNHALKWGCCRRTAQILENHLRYLHGPSHHSIWAPCYLSCIYPHNTPVVILSLRMGNRETERWKAQCTRGRLILVHVSMLHNSCSMWTKTFLLHINVLFESGLH